MVKWLLHPIRRDVPFFCMANPVDWRTCTQRIGRQFRNEGFSKRLHPPAKGGKERQGFSTGASMLRSQHSADETSMLLFHLYHHGKHCAHAHIRSFTTVHTCQ